MLALGCNADTWRKIRGDAAGEDECEVVEAEAEARATMSAASATDVQEAFKRAIAEAGPSVVAVYSTKTIAIGARHRPLNDPLFDFFFDLPRPREFKQQGIGSGFVIDGEGRILTNSHVVEGADEVKVKLADDRELVATVIGTDPPTDLALIHVDVEGLEPIELGDSTSLEVGDWVLAIGNPFGLSRTVSAGIVSAKGRANMGIVDYEDFIQTDAAVNPGNSGGPLVDLDGRVVGINTAIASSTGANAGVAFAIPIDMAKDIAAALRDGGRVVRGQLGVVVSDLTSELGASFGYEGESGILVQDVVDDGAAAKAGLREGDILTKLDGVAVESVPAFRQQIASKKPGTSVEVEVWRGGETKVLTAKLEEASTPKRAEPEPEVGPPRIGIRVEDLTPELRKRLGLQDASVGVVIVGVEPGSPAARVGIQPGDVLEQVGNEAIESAEEAAERLGAADLEKGVRVRVIRDGVGRFVILER